MTCRSVAHTFVPFFALASRPKGTESIGTQRAAYIRTSYTIRNQTHGKSTIRQKIKCLLNIFSLKLLSLSPSLSVPRSLTCFESWDETCATALASIPHRIAYVMLIKFSNIRLSVFFVHFHVPTRSIRVVYILTTRSICELPLYRELSSCMCCVHGATTDTATFANGRHFAQTFNYTEISSHQTEEIHKKNVIINHSCERISICLGVDEISANCVR